MENIVMLMLFTYPGAISFLVYKTMAKDKTFYTEPDSFTRAAWCFFLSTAVTICTFGIMAGFSEQISLSDLLKAISTTRSIWRYLRISFSCSIALGLIWYAVKRVYFGICNKLSHKNSKSQKGLRKKLWSELIEDYDLPHCVAVVTRGEKLVDAGFMEVIPDDLTTEKAIVLSYCDRVKTEYGQENHGILDNQVACYYDFDTDVRIEFIGALSLIEKIKSEASA